MSNYATKSDLKNATRVGTSDFAKNADVVNLKSDVEKLDISKLVKVLGVLNSLKSEVDNADVNKLESVPTDFKKV